MHESGIVRDLIAKAEAAARANGARKIVAIDVVLGALAGIEPAHLRGHFEIAAAGTMAEGAQLRMRTTGEPAGVLLESLELET